jgi:hypothetical protein
VSQIVAYGILPQFKIAAILDLKLPQIFSEFERMIFSSN